MGSLDTLRYCLCDTQIFDSLIPIDRRVDLLLIAPHYFCVDDLAQLDLIIMSIVAILLTFLFGYYTSEGRVLSIDSVGP